MGTPETAEQFHARIVAAADAEGRLPVATEQMPGWDIFAFELDGLRMKPLHALGEAEWPRHGDDPAECSCREKFDDARLVWSNERWRLGHVTSTGLPLDGGTLTGWLGLTTNLTATATGTNLATAAETDAQFTMITGGAADTGAGPAQFARPLSDAGI